MEKKKKVTIKEIAKAAGVSIATVSYVLNDRKDQKISEPQKKRILQIANLYHYRRNSAAKSLVTGKFNACYLYIEPNQSFLYQIDSYQYYIRLCRAFKKEGIRLFLSSEEDTSQVFDADGIISVGLDKSIFRKIGNNNFIPMISVNSFINDPLFNEILDDYSSFDKTTDNMVSLPISSELYKEYISSHFNLTIVNSLADIDSYFNYHANEKTYIRDYSILDICSQKNYHPVFLNPLSEEKIQKIIDCYQSLVAEENSKAGQFFIKAQNI